MMSMQKENNKTAFQYREPRFNCFQIDAQFISYVVVVKQLSNPTCRHTHEALKSIQITYIDNLPHITLYICLDIGRIK